MTQHTEGQGASVGQLSAGALEEWGEHVESILRGIAHALNNRAAALSAVVELSRDPADDADVTNSILSTELERVTDLVGIVRSLGAPRRGVEAFAPGDAAVEALAALKLHAETNGRAVIIDSSAASPIRVEKWMYVRALIALGASASPIIVRTEGDWLLTRAGGVAGTSTLVAELARLMGGEPLEDQRGLRLPTLAALRQREAG